MKEQIVILDFGSQYTQVIARRVRECNVYSTIIHFNTPAAKIAAMKPSGIILSGGPSSVYAPDAPLPEGIEAQTRRVVQNLKIVLEGVGLGLEHVVMARIYLTEFNRDYAALNALWPSFFVAGQLPARTTVGVTALAVGALVEIDLVARRP